MDSNDRGTRQRILEAAGLLFAERGRRNATIREIVQAAGANQAAIHYHFRDKDGLYAEVLRYGVNIAFEQHPPDGGVPSDAPALERLRGLVAAVVRRHASQDKNAWHGRLMLREMEDPSPPFIELVDEMIRIFTPLTQEIIGQINPSLGSDELDWCAQCVMCLTNCMSKDQFWLMRQPKWSELEEQERLDRLEDGLYRFCLAAIGGYKSNG